MDDHERGLEALDEFELTREVDVLREAIRLLRRAVAAGSADRRDMQEGDLGIALGRLYDQTYDLEALRESIEHLGARSTPFVPDGREFQYAIGLQKLAGETEDVAVLDQAIDRMRTLSTHDDTEQSLRARALSALGTALQDRYEYCSDQTALAEAVKRGRESIEITPVNSPRRGPHLCHLGLALRMTFESSGDILALEEAVQVCREAVAAIDEAVPSKDIEMGMLALALRVRYEALGDLDALDESVLWQRRAIEHLPEGHGRLTPHRSNLALALWTRADRTGDLATVNAAIQAARIAVESTSPESSDRRLYANNLGLALMTAARVRPETNELDEAISIFRGILDRTSADRSLAHEAASNLALALRQRGRDEADLNDAIAAAETADRLAPEGHVAQVRYRALIGVLHREGAGRTADKDVKLAASVSALRSALAVVAADNPDRAMVQLELASSLLAACPREPAARAEALRLVADAAAIGSAPPRITVDASRTAAELLAEDGKLQGAVDFYERAVEGLSRVAPQTADLLDRGAELERFLGVASEAASCALEAGDSLRALNLLERGRALLFGALLDDVPRLAHLRRLHPELAHEFENVRGMVDIGGVNALSIPEAEKRHQHRRKWDAVVDRIRAQDGFENFLRPTVAVESIPGKDPVVVLLAGRSRCHAIVLAGGKATSISLPGVDRSGVRARSLELRQRIDEVADATAGGRPIAERRFAEMFAQVSAWTFDEVIRPISPLIQGAARVNWIPTGPFSGIPLHAAGDRTAGDALNSFVSNYAASIGSLSHRDRRLGAQGVAVVGGEDPALGGADREAIEVAERLGAQVRLRSVDATKDAVLAVFRRVSVVHVAVHGFANPRKRFAGGLALADGDVGAIDLARSGGGLDLAYLSACDTASADDQISDEPLHLAAALRAAGCRDVVAAMWPLDDRAGATIATGFYADGVPRDTAAALNRAQRRAWTAEAGRPSVWATMTHWGPAE